VTFDNNSRMQGFDVDIRIPTSSLYVYKCANNDDLRGDIVGICARVGLHWYNFQKVKNSHLGLTTLLVFFY